MRNTIKQVLVVFLYSQFCFVILLSLEAGSEKSLLMCASIVISLVLTDYFMLYMMERFNYLVQKQYEDAMYGNKSSYRCHNGHVSRIRGEELEATLLDIARNMALAQLQEFELKTDGGNCPDNLEREIESLKKSKAHYAKLKFEIYDDYTKTNITRDQMAKKTAEVKQKIAEIESLITEKQETLDMQKDLFLDAKQEQLTKLSKLDEFDEEVIRYLIDYVLVYDNEHIEIRWNFDDFQAG